MLLMIDNYDSFTYNIVRYLIELGADVRVVRNDEVGLDDIRRMAPERIVISPGPCTPFEAGVSVPVIQAFAGEVPILGVCLGHQCIGHAFGAEIRRSQAIMHGKTSSIHHSGEGIFHGLPETFRATRYHSLVVARDNLPEVLKVTAWTCDHYSGIDEIMGIRHIEHEIHGIQFHPESILSEFGHALLERFLHAQQHLNNNFGGDDGRKASVE